jgi:nucleoside-diphosphate-sugar epimerase
MNILISGIHGFVGSNLVAALKEEHTIYGLDIVSPQKDGVSHTYSWNELKDIPSIDCIIHLAGKAHDTKNKSSAQTYFDINTELTKKIFDWFLTTTTHKFIFFSSAKAATDEVIGDWLTEDVAPTPKGPYGKSKMLAEKYIQDQLPLPNIGFRSSVYVPSSYEKKVYILRPSMIHGPGNKGNLNLLYKLVSKGIPWPLSAFDNKRSFASIDNVAFVVQQLIEKDIESDIYNLADDDTLSTNQLIELIAQSKGKKALFWRIPKKIIIIGAHLGGLIHLPLNPERLKKLTESYAVSNQKIKHALDIEKMPVSAKEGLINTFKSF